VRGRPDAEVERDFHPGLGVVVRPGNRNLDCDSLGVRSHVSHAHYAVGIPKETEEFLGEAGVAQAYVHGTFTVFDVPDSGKSGP
jgi:hypothetical protein